MLQNAHNCELGKEGIVAIPGKCGSEDNANTTLRLKIMSTIAVAMASSAELFFH